MRHLLEQTTPDDIAMIIAIMAVIVVIGLAIDIFFSVVDRRIRRRRGLPVPV